MARGGARNRSGPRPDPKSLRSARRDLAFRLLDPEGFKGEPPEFPLPVMRRFRWEYEGKARRQVVDEELTLLMRERELDVWAEVWRSPQATVWIGEPWRWPMVAEYCRLKTVVEGEPDANAALVGQMHRYRDQLGLTPAGLKENGWQIAGAEPEAGGGEADKGGNVVEMFRGIGGTA